MGSFDTICVVSHRRDVTMTVNDKHAFDDLLDNVEPTTDKQITQHDERLVFRTDHLHNYQALGDLIALEGEDYTPIIKAVWYSVIGALKPQYIKFSNITTDTRFNLLVVLPSGSGKDNFKQAIIKIMRACSRGVEEPAAFHPEQLIGKVILRGKGKDKEYIPNYGHFSKDYLLFNEVYDFLTEKDRLYKESRNYMTKALDPIGHNEVYKRLIDNLDTENEVLRYCPRCTISMFLQPRYLDEDVVLSGFIRRYLIMYVPMFGKNLDRKEEIIKYVKTPHPEVSFEYWKEIAEWNCYVGFDGRVNVTFEEGIDDLLVVLHEDLMEYARSLGEKQRNYLDRNTFALLGYLIKMAAIQAISRKSDVVTQEDVKLAYMDLFEFFKLTLDYVDAKVMGNLDYGEKWHGAEAKEIEALKWMVKQGALDEERSKTTIGGLIDHLMNLFGVGEEAARKRYQKLKKRSLIDSKQVGSDSSRVWIAFDPDPDTFNDDPVPLSDTLYWKIAHDENCILPDTTLPPLPSLSPIAVQGGNPKYHPSADSDSEIPPCKIDGEIYNQSGADDVEGGKMETDSEGQGGKCDTTLKTIAVDMGGKGGRVVSGDMQNPIELAQQDRMNGIDQFFREHRDKDGKPAEISYASREQLVEFVLEIAEQLHINTDVVFRSVMEYGKHRGWVR